MATFNLNPSIPQVTGLTSIGAGIKNTTLSWTAVVVSGVSYQIYKSATNTISSATLFDVTDASTYTATGLDSSVTNYFWVRAVDPQGYTGPFSGALSGIGDGVAGLLGTITSLDTGTTGVLSSSTSVSTAWTSPSITNYGQWYNVGYAGFTATANLCCTVSVSLGALVSSVSVGTNERLQVLARCILLDNTTGLYVDGTTATHLLYQNWNVLGVVQVNGSLDTLTNYSQFFVSGFRGVLIPGHSYGWNVQISKVRTAGSPTCGVQVTYSDATASAGSLS
ncbi:hypothetical protein [Aquabacterium sp.]|uniref:hypothetical protein n=1 Tax=Aquabacterium sp. TaxID=1872578 RepID=UPI003D6D79A2